MNLLIKQFLLLLLCWSSKTVAQNVSLSLENARVEKVFAEIKKQTGLSFIYMSEQVQGLDLVSVRVHNKPLDLVLKQCFRNHPLTFEIEKPYIIVRRKATIKKDMLFQLSGQVLSNLGEPLAGANVVGDKTGIYAVTDHEGKFSLSTAKIIKAIEVSYVGFIPQHINVTGNGVINIQMMPVNDILDETIVIGYGITTQRARTASVSKISGDELSSQPVSNLLGALQGRVAGLNIIQKSGLPGSDFSVLIRGQNSIQNGNSPLFILDGIPFLSSSDNLTQVSQLNANNPYNTINPRDIESVIVLKDADATSIYGSRGANGVILINTKDPSKQKRGLLIDVYRGWGRSSYTTEYLKTGEYLQLRREAFWNDRVEPDRFNAPDLLVWDTIRYTNWKSKLIGGTAGILNVHANYSIGDLNTQLLFGTNHYRETTVFPGQARLSRSTVNFFLKHKSASNRFHAGILSNYSSHNSYLYQQDLTRYINTIPNLPETYNDQGDLEWQYNGQNFDNPMAQLQRSYDALMDRLLFSGSLSYQVGKFIFKSNGGYQAMWVKELSQVPLSSQNPVLNPSAFKAEGKRKEFGWIWEPQIKFNTVFGGKGNAEFMAGATWQQALSHYNLLWVENLTASNGEVEENDLLIKTDLNYSGLYYKYHSVYGKSNFRWDDRYIVNLSFRRDGSSRLSPGNQFANFGAVGIAWIFSDEKWLNGMPLLNFGKIRTSYGWTGNDQIEDFQYIESWNKTMYDYDSITGIYPTQIANPYYGWERKRNIELGLDLFFFNSKFLLTINWFNSLSDNQILWFRLPGQTGSNRILRNFPCKVRNRGIELESTITWIKRTGLSWSTFLNMTIAKNRLIKFPGLSSSSYANTFVEGESVGVLTGYRFLGVDPVNGIYRFKDINGDNMLNSEDYHVIGDTDPKYYGGLNNVIKLNNWELQLMFQWVRQKGWHVVYSSPSLIGTPVNQPIQILGRWKAFGDDVSFQKSAQSVLSSSFTPSFSVLNSDAVLTDASYLRLKSLNVAYNVRDLKILKLNMPGLKVYAEAQNLITLTGYKGPNPESQLTTVLPPLKVFAIGIKAEF